MSETGQAPIVQEATSESQTERVAPYDILFITRAYNRRELSFDDWLEQASV